MLYFFCDIEITYLFIRKNSPAQLAIFLVEAGGALFRVDGLSRVFKMSVVTQREKAALLRGLTLPLITKNSGNGCMDGVAGVPGISLSFSFKEMNHSSPVALL